MTDVEEEDDGRGRVIRERKRAGKRAGPSGPN
jgi:hypothetical protein